MYQTPPLQLCSDADLPGELEVSDPLVAYAVVRLNELSELRGLDGTRRLGEFVLSAFFGRDSEQFRTRSRSHRSFRALLASEDLKPTASTLWYAVAIVEQCAVLPSKVANALTLSHHRILLPIQTIESKRRLARLAVNGELSKRELELLIRKQKNRLPRRSPGGRKALPALVKGLTRVNAALDLASSEPADPSSFEDYPIEDARVLLANAYVQMDRLATLTELLRRRIMLMDRAAQVEQAQVEQAQIEQSQPIAVDQAAK